MNFLDLKTVIFINVITDCLCTLVVILLWLNNRNRFRGTSFWAADFACQTAALFLIILRGAIADWASMVLSGTLVITGALLGYMGLERFVGRKVPQVPNYILLAAFMVFSSYFAVLQPNLAARSFLISLCLLIICVQCAWLMLWGSPPAMRKTTRGTGVVFAGFCLVSLVRIPVIVLSLRHVSDFFKSGVYDTLLIVAYQLLLIALSYGLTLMINKRLLLDIQIQEEKYSKAFKSSPYAISLTRLSDGQILEINDGFVKMSGYPREELIGEKTIDLHLWDNQEERAEITNQLANNKAVREKEYRFRKKSGETITALFSAETIMLDNIPCALSVVMDISERKRTEQEREKLLAELGNALSQVKKLSGLLPICSHCKKIRDDKGYWKQLEEYITDHSEAEFSHGICKECVEKYYPDFKIT